MKRKNRLETIEKGMGILATTLIIFVLFGSSANATIIPSEEWNKTYGGIAYDYTKSVKQTSDGGYIIAGTTASIGSGGIDGWLIKTYENGTEKWNITYGSYGNDDFTSIQQTSDGGYIIAGTTASIGSGGIDGWLIKTYENGTMQFNKAFGGVNWDGISCIIQTIDGNYLAVGITYSFGSGSSDGWLIKFDKNGNKLWEKFFGGPLFDSLTSVQQTSDGGYIIAGTTASIGSGGIDGWLIKTYENGTMQFNKAFGGVSADEFSSAQYTIDGGYIIAGRTNSFGYGNTDAWVIKTYNNGTEAWNKTFGGIGYDISTFAQQTLDGEYLIASQTKSFGAGNSDGWLIKLNSSGYNQWNVSFGGINNDYILFALQTLDNKYLASGITYSYGSGDSDIWLVKFSSDSYEIFPTLKSIAIKPSSMRLNSSETLVFTATAIDENDTPLSGINISWSVDNSTVGNVTPRYSITGLDGNATATFTALEAGKTNISAQNGTKSDLEEVNVTAPTETPAPMIVSIISPTSEDIYSTNKLDHEIIYNGTVSGGTPGFKYIWIIDGNEYAHIEEKNERISEWPSNGWTLGAGEHTVKLRVQDSNGNSAESSETTFNIYTKTIAIIPVDFNDEQHSTNQYAEELWKKADNIAKYYGSQSYGTEKIGYKVISNQSGNNGWFRINEKFEDIYQGKYLTDPPLTKDRVICGPLIDPNDCDLPKGAEFDQTYRDINTKEIVPLYGAYWEGNMYVWFSGMRETGLYVGMNMNDYYQKTYGLDYKMFKPEDFDVGIVVYATIPEICYANPDKDPDKECFPSAPEYKGTGDIFMHAPRVIDYWVHEMGHIYGLGDEHRMGNWSVMLGPPAQNPPPPLTFYDKEKIGWLWTSEIKRSYGTYTVQMITDPTVKDNGILKYGNKNKYYIFEGRSPADNVASESGLIPDPGSLLQKVEGVEIYEVTYDANRKDYVPTALPAQSGDDRFNRVTLVSGESIIVGSHNVRVTANKDTVSGIWTVTIAPRK